MYSGSSLQAERELFSQLYVLAVTELSTVDISCFAALENGGLLPHCYIAALNTEDCWHTAL